LKGRVEFCASVAPDTYGLCVDREDRAALKTPWSLRLLRARRLKDLRARASTDPEAQEQLANELVVWFMESVRRQRFDDALVAAQENLAVNRRMAADDATRGQRLAEALNMFALGLVESKRYAEAEPVGAELVEIARASRAGGNTEVEPLIRSGLAVLALCRMDDSLIREVTGPRVTPLIDEDHRGRTHGKLPEIAAVSTAYVTAHACGLNR